MRRAVLLALAALLPGGCVQDWRPRGPAQETPAIRREIRAPGPDAELVARPVAIMEDGYRLPLTIHPQRGGLRGVILALHGMNDYGAAWDDPAPWFAQAGLLLYAPDLRGFGRTVDRGYWPGGAALVADTQTLLRLIAARHPGMPLYLMGESMGGALAIVTLADPATPKVDAAILLAPALWGRASMGALPRLALALADALIPGFPLTGEGMNIQASDNLEMLRRLGRDPLVGKQTRVDAARGLVDLMDQAQAAAQALRTPSLLIHGARDQLIPGGPIDRFAASLPPEARLTLLRRPGGWHLLLRDLDGKQVADAILAWIAPPVPRSPP